jgi:hypothetical protein
MRAGHIRPHCEVIPLNNFLPALFPAVLNDLRILNRLTYFLVNKALPNPPQSTRQRYL